MRIMMLFFAVLISILIFIAPSRARGDSMAALLKEGQQWPIEHISASLVDADLFYMIGVKHDRRNPVTFQWMRTVELFGHKFPVVIQWIDEEYFLRAALQLETGEIIAGDGVVAEIIPDSSVKPPYRHLRFTLFKKEKQIAMQEMIAVAIPVPDERRCQRVCDAFHQGELCTQPREWKFQENTIGTRQIWQCDTSVISGFWSHALREIVLQIWQDGGKRFIALTLENHQRVATEVYDDAGSPLHFDEQTNMLSARLWIPPTLHQRIIPFSD